MFVHPKKNILLKEIKQLSNFKEIPNALDLYGKQINKVIDVR